MFNPMQLLFAFVIAATDPSLDGSEIHIRAEDEAHAARLAAARSRMFGAPLRRAVDRDVPPISKRGAA